MNDGWTDTGWVGGWTGDVRGQMEGGRDDGWVDEWMADDGWEEMHLSAIVSQKLSF